MFLRLEVVPYVFLDFQLPGRGKESMEMESLFFGRVMLINVVEEDQRRSKFFIHFKQPSLNPGKSR